MNNNRNYNTESRKKLVSNLENIKDNNELNKIYTIITDEIGSDYSSNSNGMFFNLNILSDNCIEKLLEVIKNNNTNNNLSKIENNDYKSYKFDEIDNIIDSGHKLSNQEKHIIKKNRSIK